MTTNQRGALIFVIIVAAAIVFCGIIPFSILQPNGAAVAIPVITVPGEPYLKDWPSKAFYLTNTWAAIIVADILVVVLAIVAWRVSKGWRNEVPGRLQSIFELLGDFVYGLTKNFAGVKPLARNWLFPLAASIFFFLLVVNWMKLIPGVESVGVVHCAGHSDPEIGITVSTGYPKIDNRLWVASALNSGYPADEDDYHACEEYKEGKLPKPEKEAIEAAAALLTEEEEALRASWEALPEAERPDAAAQADQLAALRLEVTESVWEHAGIGLTADELKLGVVPYLFVITPYLRGGSTDLNLTIGLAVIVFFAIQIFGVAAQGPAYFLKFINLTALGNAGKNPIGAIDFAVGLFEIVSEIGKIISLAFRLFGNLFAGGILLAVIAFLVAFLVPMVIYGLELIITTIQAFVFAVLTLVFAGQAMAGHHHAEEEHH
jgi:F-type H+-transporting ATPase subunit a